MKSQFAVAAGIALLGVGLMSGCAGQVATEPTPTPTAQEARLSAAMGTCGIRYDDGAALGDAGQNLTLDEKGQDDFAGLPYDDVQCVLTDLGIPDATMNLIETTRALDGRQTGSWDGIDATWSYHPDSGVNVTLVDQDFEG